MPVFDFSKTRRLIRNTGRGKERNMYPHLRDLFAHLLGHPAENIITDSPQDAGGVPDLAIRCNTGVVDAKERPIYYDWIVVEAKDEGGVFLDAAKREEIFADKQKYIRPQTEWFVMADPQCIVVRPIAVRQTVSADGDMVFRWEELADGKIFCEKLKFLHADSAADSPALKAFRAGDERRIAVVRVDAPADARETLSAAEQARLALAKKDFLAVVRDSTKILQNACRWALADWAPLLADINKTRDAFEARWGGYAICYDPLEIKGMRRRESKEEADEHKAQVLELQEAVRKNRAVAKLALTALPAYRRRNSGDTNEPFTIETANLILARILLLRFFEDHNFFGDAKYVCNGGIVALREFMRHYGEGYTAVLREAYKKGGGIYRKAFDETDFDWVLASENKSVSVAVELTMMLLSRFDFSTISGDILTGIYDRFLERGQRKAMGEFYTPPSVARYIVNRLDIRPGDSVFDPACGSGTFLLEAFDKMTNGDIRGGRGNYQQAAAALAQLGGGDINPFSALVSQIQILWNLLPLKTELKARGFPEIRVAGGENSIIASGNLQGGNDTFSALNRPVHSAVIGNPPYVRPERSGEFDEETDAFYKKIGGAKKDFYDLFVYKALTQWCRKENGENAAGRLGFVLPLSFCDSGKSAPLRKLFAAGPGGQFRILEIVDMEAIAPLVFDAAVNPIILFAENRPATAADKIAIRIAGAESVCGDGEFNLAAAPKSEFAYSEVFSADGRILTKLSAQKKPIINKMRQTKNTLADIARPYWVGIGGKNRIVDWQLAPPAPPAEGTAAGAKTPAKTKAPRYEERRMLARGATFRGKWETAANGDGMDYYKGENIAACRIEGEAQRGNLLPDSLDDSSFWGFRHILPEVGYAFLGIALGITGARFNPREIAFLDTATLLLPCAEWENFPLDIALSSRVYQFYYGCYLREGTLSHSWRSHVYPRTLELIPFPPALLKSAAKLEKLRGQFLDSCHKIHQRGEAVDGFLLEEETIPLKIACREAGLPMRWSDGLQNGAAVKISAPKTDSVKVKENRLLLSNGDLLNGGEWVEVDNADILRRAAAGLAAQHGRELKRCHLLEMPIPANDAALKNFSAKMRRLEAGAFEDALERTLAEVDAIVGAAFGLTKKEVAYVQGEMRDDGFLRNIRQNLPFVERRRKGLSDKLANPNRYQRRES